MGSTGEDRPGQHEMTRAVADAIAERTPPRRAGRHRHRQVARLSRPAIGGRGEGGRRHRHQGPAGSARRQGAALPRRAPRRGRSTWAVLKGRVQLRVPPAPATRPRRRRRPSSGSRTWPPSPTRSRGLRDWAEDHRDGRPGRARPRASAAGRGRRSASGRGNARAPPTARGRGVLRRAGPGRGRRRRRGRGQHPPLRAPPRGRRRRASRARPRGHRRGPPVRRRGVGHVRPRAVRGPVHQPGPHHRGHPGRPVLDGRPRAGGSHLSDALSDQVGRRLRGAMDQDLSDGSTSGGYGSRPCWPRFAPCPTTGPATSGPASSGP